MGYVLAVLVGPGKEGIRGDGGGEAVQVEVGGRGALAGCEWRPQGGEGEGVSEVALPEPDEGIPAPEVDDEGSSRAITVVAGVRMTTLDLEKRGAYKEIPFSLLINIG